MSQTDKKWKFMLPFVITPSTPDLDKGAILNLIRMIEQKSIINQHKFLKFLINFFTDFGTHNNCNTRLQDNFGGGRG